MKFGRALLLGAAGSVLLAGSAFAADIPQPPGPPPPPPPPPAPMFSWSGPYVGAFAGYDFTLSGAIAGVQFGYNWEFGNFVAGLEVETIYPIFGATLVDARLNARLGAAFADKFLVYGEAGIGSWVAVPVWTVGGGVEYAVSDSLSLFAEAEAVFVMGGGYVATQLTGGMNYHAGEGGMSSSGPHDWSGLYFGTLGGWSTTFGLSEFGVQVGYNFAWDRFVAGLEIETTHPGAGGALINASLNARAGYAVGDRVLVYGEAGIGEWLFVPTYTLGGGVEFAVGDQMSLFAEAKAQGFIGGGIFGTVIRGGVNVHFGR